MISICVYLHRKHYKTHKELESMIFMTFQILKHIFFKPIKRLQSGFLQTHKNCSIGIIVKFVSPYNCSVIPHLYHMVLVNVKIIVCRY